MARELAYSVLDVFAERALEGNPLAVFHDGRGLSDEQMQALARETNLSETTFVLPSDDPAEDRAGGVRVRIFTTEEELPFAGHPTLGTASWLHGSPGPLQGAEVVTLRLKVGPIPVRFAAGQGEPAGPGINGAGIDGAGIDRAGIPGAGIYGTMRQRDPEFGAEHDAAEVAEVIGMAEADLLPGYRPQTVSTGNPFCIVALRSVEALSRLAIPQREASAWLRARGIRWFYCIAPAGEASWRTRMQWASGEDPATGSAAGPAIAWLVRTGLAAPGAPVMFEQGVEMGRPSRLTVEAKRDGGSVSDVHVAGRTILVATGRYFLPG